MNLFNNYNVRRKVVHFFTGATFVLIINFININLQLFFLFGLVCSIILSIYTKYFRPKLIFFFLSLVDKPEDLEKFPGKGSIYYLIGVLITVTFFSKDVASAAILILTVGDPMAYYFGKYHGKTKLIVNKNKVLEGTLAGTFFGTIAAAIFVPLHVAFFGAAFGMMAEAIDLKYNLDDNVMIPIVSGTIMTIIFSML